MALPKIDLYALADAERLQLLEQVWESFRQDPESLPVTAAQRAELDRRQAAYDAGDLRTHSWREVREEIRSRLRPQL